MAHFSVRPIAMFRDTRLVSIHSFSQTIKLTWGSHCRFMQAMPAMSEYITLDVAHQNVIRLKLETPVSGLSSGSGLIIPYYLGHKPDESVTPRLVGVKGTIQNKWEMAEYQTEIPLFAPKT